MAKIQETIAAQLSRYSIAGYDNIKQHVILSVALAFCIMAHTYLLVFFAMGKIEPLIIANIGSLAIYYFTAAFLIKRRRYLIIRTIIVCEVSLYATFTGYMFGIGNYIIGNFLLILVLQLLLPYGDLWYRWMLSLFSISLMVFSFSLGYITAPVLVLPDFENGIFIAANICIMLFGTCIEIKIEQIILSVIDESHKYSLEKATLAANTDALTSAYNRRYADEYIENLQASSPNVNFCVAMVDADKFKEINDVLGHDVGDQVLIHITKYFQTHLRQNDMLFRWGGDEFLIILKEITLPQAHGVLDRVRKQLIDTPFQAKNQAVNISISVGVAEFDLCNPYASIERCDQNLLVSKQRGRNMVYSGL
ncbi:GGDEF domain-containing protein [Agathobaculum sp. LCP25S3_E8]|uniref:GGDEF domain-containing protein n=1 Tax=Agathobaculum sp. LCP25S3_E8 TaxID=3438735 RepID=UPI003F93670A